jgi:hypothetical protein
MEQIEQALIQPLYVARPVVSEKLVETFDRVRNVLISASVNNVDALIRVGVEETQAIFLRGSIRGGRGRGLQNDGKKSRHQCEQQ